MYQNPNASSASSDGFQDNTAPAYQLAMQAQIMQWVTAMQNPYTSPLQYNNFSQQQHASLPGGITGASSMLQNSPFNNSGPTLPVHVADDVFRMIHPVGSSPDDDRLLAQAIHDSAVNGQTYRQAIEGLHGMNNHPAHLWKDYYLDHRPRINVLVSRISSQSSGTVKGSFVSSEVLTHSEGSSNVAPVTRKARSRPSLQDQPKIAGQRMPSGRATINSITAHPPPRSNPHANPHAHITIPDTPSREPSPPSQIIAFRQSGNLFTRSDTDFMLKFISWELHRNPTLNKSNLSHRLEAKASHHPFSSWMQHMRAAGPIVDKMIAVARGEEGDSSSEDEAQSKTQVESDVGCQSGSDSGAIAAEFDEDSGDDEINMGIPGKSYTAADRRLLAKYIATVDDWDYQEDSVRFAMFHQRFPHRALTSWSRYYSRNEKGIDRLAKKYKQRSEQSAPDLAEHGRQSWASSSSNGSLPSALKRKFRSEEFGADRAGLGYKRSRAGTGDLPTA